MRYFLCFLLALGAAGGGGFRAGAQGITPAARSFDDIFPGLAPDVRSAAFSRDGYFRTLERPGGGTLRDTVAYGSGLDPALLDSVVSMRPVVMVESIMVIPGAGLSLLEVYNALSRIRDLRGRTFDSHRRGEIPLFDEATRLSDGRRNTAVADPPPSATVPRAETVYIRLRDANFGNTFYRASMTLDGRGLRYSLTNNRNITYLMVPVIREGRFVAQMYFEPVAEGILIYSLAGVDVSDFVSSRIHMPSAISKRLAVITGWAADGIAR